MQTMKLNNIYIFIVILFAGYVFMGHSAGRADSQNWGNTGAPGDETLSNGQPRTCISCHGGSSIGVDLGIEIRNQDGSVLENNEYIPGTTYDMSVTLATTAGSPVEYGFQMVALTDSDEQEVNTWANTSSNTEIAFASNTGRTYVEQSVPSSSNTFTMEWTAPAAGSGGVTFYSCGNGVNNNNTTSGDGADCSTLSLAEAQTNSLVNLNTDAIQLELSPNPAVDYLQVAINTQLQDNFELNILNMSGQKIHTQTWIANTADMVDISIIDFPAGIYFVQLTNASYSNAVKWVKL